MLDPLPRRRAAPLPPDQRRAALIDATLPLLLEHGTAVTTQEIARAAEVAEGTIFRAFPDKDALIRATVERAFDPGPTEALLRAIDPALPLAVRLERAVAIMQDRFATIGRLMMAVGMANPPARPGAGAKGRTPPSIDALASVFAPDRDRLRRSPVEAAQLLRGLAFAGSHPTLIIDHPLEPAEIVSVLLHGIAEKDDHRC